MKTKLNIKIVEDEDKNKYIHVNKSDTIQLHYDMIGAHYSGFNEHPQVVMNAFNIYGVRYVPEPIGDCWIVLADKMDTSTLPDFIQVIQLDDEYWEGNGVKFEI